MIDKGHRLSFSIIGNNYSVTDNNTGNAVIYNNDRFIVREIPDDILIPFCENLEHLLCKYKENASWLRKSYLDNSNKDSVIIIEESHYVYNMLAFGKSARLTEIGFQKNLLFKTDRVLSLINRFHTLLISDSSLLKPMFDIVRRIPDVGVLVWVYDGHTVICYESNIMGSIMLDCLIDKTFYRLVYVSSNEDSNECNIFDGNLKLIVTFPCDSSILTYYPNDNDSFKDA